MKNNFGTYSDEQLVGLLKGPKKKRELAFNEIYERYSQMVHAYCCCIVKNRDVVDDIFQETFIRFLKKVDTKRECSNIPGFLVTIAKNLCFNYVRNKKHNIPVEETHLTNGNSDSYEKQELLELLISTVDLLDPIYREAFIMREFKGMRYKEIAKEASISLPNAKLRVTRARKKIIDILSPYLKDIAENV